MDYLNIQKTRRHYIILMVGYILIGVGIVLGTRLLLEAAAGYGLGKNGTVIQNGEVYFSSQPHQASIYLDGQLNPKKTNTRLLLPANVYQVKLSRAGYRDWQRVVNLNGGSVEHFDYPLLFPTKLVTKKLASYNTAPDVMTQSPDRRWLLVQEPGALTTFDVYDLNSPDKASTDISLPAGVATTATSNESWQFVDWADDNQHVLLQHNYDGKTEFILLDRSDPTQSVNLTTTLATTGSETISLNNKKYDQYYIYDQTTGVLQTASLGAPTLVPRLDHVLAYKSYGNDIIIYVTDDGAPTGKVLVKLISGTKTTTLRSLPVGSSYLVDLTQYSGVTYVAMGTASANKIYIYRDPVGQLAAQPDHAIVPVQVLHVEQPNYLSFSNNAQFIVAENAQSFGVYDIENKVGYNYTSPAPLDTPQQHASWMDGDRLIYVSGGKLNVADYDNANRQTLQPASSNYLAAFSPNYNFVYNLAPSITTGQFDLTQTALLIPADQ